jgi:hypothetical protein
LNLSTVLISLFVFVIGPVWLSFFLRRRRPGQMRLGLPLAFLFPMFSQFYLPGATTYIIIVFICGVLLYKLSVTGVLLWGCTGIVSAALMYRRLKSRNTAG